MNEYHEQVADQVQQIIEAHAEGAEADAGFDGGEWSGPAHARAEEEEISGFLAAHCIGESTIYDILERRWMDDCHNYHEVG